MVTTTTGSALSPKTRWTIVGLLSASITINLLDRQVLSVLANELRNAFQWSNAQYGYIAVAFNLGMMMGQVPAGSLMDRLGTRIGLALELCIGDPRAVEIDRHAIGALCRLRGEVAIDAGARYLQRARHAGRPVREMARKSHSR